MIQKRWYFYISLPTFWGLDLDRRYGGMLQPIRQALWLIPWLIDGKLITTTLTGCCITTLQSKLLLHQNIFILRCCCITPFLFETMLLHRNIGKNRCCIATYVFIWNCCCITTYVFGWTCCCILTYLSESAVASQHYKSEPLLHHSISQKCCCITTFLSEPLLNHFII